MAKLFIPGPIDVSPATFAAMSQPMIGHRGSEFEALYASLQPGLREIIGTTRPVYLSTSSAWGVMEASLKNLCQKKVLNLCCGAFSDKWFSVAKSMGIDADKIQVEWGQAIDPESVRAKLAEGGFDLVTLPPGLTDFAISEAALERAKSTSNRGYYFDFIEFEKNAVANNTPSTPAISLLFGLQHILGTIANEGLAARYARHAATNAQIHAWGDRHGFKNFAPEGFQSKSLTCFHTPEGFDLSAFIKSLKSKHGFVINGGYGKIKGLTFRISNMGNETEATMNELIAAMDDVLG